ncbi:DUF732 domain-containing protein [Mycobacterium montefiorense]|uniref:DUF732 domain-containing protein n=1 Tax=Mycobacterium montefiorense TaxID=154654 RepID=A0AA37PJT2_9MYCO|nr:DUF732 domain-containing protein [Mycobacterium montefiorense]GBG38880.1 hypothetical protein MmonteBS_32520 [Mycobacterium montefiorense]GKU32668.1 hypothetical protein NJB14191_00150 [Mycobacterium montefiorense]GKU38190.1 hypothetical protein NJB14192_01880 [Mycobacterium montefiorense]GKU43478.1 hypothetical protein NJB14194_01110 [Mycobacterium montefiorense]GKU50219.1 hypothetical protein NJB14195_14650 [Mycobacterium montefiorense]
MKLLPTLVVVIGAIGLATPAHAEPEGDDSLFLARLGDAGITYSSPSQVIASAKAVCGMMGRGETGLQVVSDIKDQNPGMTLDAAAKFAALASDAYCPHHLTPKAG